MRLELSISVELRWTWGSVSVAHTSQTIVVIPVYIINLNMIHSKLQIESRDNQKFIFLSSKHTNSIYNQIFNLIGGKVDW
jgi:hypothetical protein